MKIKVAELEKLVRTALLKKLVLSGEAWFTLDRSGKNLGGINKIKRKIGLYK